MRNDRRSVACVTMREMQGGACGVLGGTLFLGINKKEFLLCCCVIDVELCLYITRVVFMYVQGLRAAEL
jgi:hypothetical protein